jgi:hypothetical protein
MAYTFSAVINGITFDQDDFLGMAYLQGIPDSLEAMGDQVLANGTVTSSTSFTPGTSGNVSLTLDSASITFLPGSTVMVFGSVSSYQMGTVVSWDPVTKVLVVQKQYAQGASPGSSWLIWVAPAPFGYDAAWAGPRQRTVDEGGIIAGLRRYRASGGVSEDLLLPTYPNVWPLPATMQRSGWDLSFYGYGTNLQGQTITTETITTGADSSLMLTYPLFMDVDGPGMIRFDMVQGLASSAGPTYFRAGLVDASGLYSLDIVKGSQQGGWHTEIRHHTPVSGLQTISLPDHTRFLISMGANQLSRELAIYAWTGSEGAATFKTPIFTTGLWRSRSVKFRIFAMSYSTADESSVRFSPISITQPLRNR